MNVIDSKIIDLLNAIFRHNQQGSPMLNASYSNLSECYREWCGVFDENQNLRKQNDLYHKALLDIDTHIRSTKKPTPFIIETLNDILPEYKTE